MFKFWRKKQDRKKVWTDTQIDLYERQMAARAALGTRYLCHPINSSPRKDVVRGQEISFDHYPPPKLTLVRSR